MVHLIDLLIDEFGFIFKGFFCLTYNSEVYIKILLIQMDLLTYISQKIIAKSQKSISVQELGYLLML